MTRVLKVLRPVFELLAQVLVDVLLKPENIEKCKAALSTILSERVINAPEKGEADEELQKKIENSGMADVPLPDRHPGA